jgi:hypothetical protein
VFSASEAKLQVTVLLVSAARPSSLAAVRVLVPVWASSSSVTPVQVAVAHEDGEVDVAIYLDPSAVKRLSEILKN